MTNYVSQLTTWTHSMEVVQVADRLYRTVQDGIGLYSTRLYKTVQTGLYSTRLYKTVQTGLYCPRLYNSK